jgi:hypothetical protein
MQRRPGAISSSPNPDRLIMSSTPRRYADAIQCFSHESALRDFGVVLQQVNWGSEFGTKRAVERRSTSILSPTAMATQSAMPYDVTKEQVANSCIDLLKKIVS